MNSLPIRAPSPTAEQAAPATSTQEHANVCFISRQPILDRLGRVHAYSLLPRTEEGTVASQQHDLGTRGLIDNTLLYGFDQLTQGAAAMIPCTPETLQDGITEMLPPTLTILQLKPGPETSDELLQACSARKKAGFRFCMAGSEIGRVPAALVEMMDYVKVDFSSTPHSDREDLLQKAIACAAAPIAEKVETESDYNQASREGFGLFHGFYFCRPELFRKHEVPANRLAQLQILRLLQQETCDLAEVGKWVRNDTSLTYRMLRLVNSPICAIRQDVRSIETALMILGEMTFRRMALVAVSSELNTGNSVEILRMAFLRSYFCEQMAESCKLNAAEQYLLGMLSLLPVMLGRPMAELTAGLPLRDDLRLALAGSANRERILLSWLEAHEAGNWNTANKIALANSLSTERLIASYMESIAHAEELLRLAL
ncbi:EAL and HDOD domain-containing protein [Telmatobacter bradus]|uniref:EAL and HDOD domain-containing protein n=1 Tax=Telmatobacter bradus TaxID=474953 RepID=UPI003B42C912